MTLYYGVQQVDLNGLTAQFGLYFRNNNLAFPFVGNAWSSALTSLLEVVTPAGLSYVGMMSPADTITSRWVYKIDATTDRKIDATDHTIDGTVGSSAGNQLPRSTSVLVLWRQGSQTHPLGRLYLPRVSTTVMQSGDLDPTATLATHQAVGQLYTDLTGNLCTPVIRSRKMHTDVPATTFVVSSRFAHVSTRADARKPTYI